jgi:UDP-glucose 4-epimerase
VATTAVDQADAPAGAEWPSVVGPLESLDLRAVIEEADADAVFHLASPAFVPPSLVDPVGDLLGNAGSTLLLLEAVRRCGRPPVVALMSSAAIYGTARSLPMGEDHPLEPTSPYGVAKLAAEEYLRLYTRLYDIDGFAARPFSLYGPGQQKLIVFDLFRRVLAGEDPLVIHGRREVTRDLLYVGDAARSIVALARNAPARGESYNLGAGRAVSLGDLADAVVAATGVPVAVEFTGEVRAGDPLHWEADTSRATALGAGAVTPLDEGLAKTAAWVRELTAALPVAARSRDR